MNQRLLTRSKAQIELEGGGKPFLIEKMKILQPFEPGHVDEWISPNSLLAPAFGTMPHTDGRDIRMVPSDMCHPLGRGRVRQVPPRSDHSDAVTSNPRYCQS
jgi:hypothetical protein